MRKLLSLLTLAAYVPLFVASAAALDYSNSSLRYEDAPFIRSEAAGISLLTNVGAVSGNPDGTYGARRLLNRAEFLKILLASRYEEISPSTLDCFPDVRSGQWFAMYVCEGKDLEVAKGNPDGFFRPERNVNLAEAVTMAVRLWELPLPQYVREPDNWYDPYFDAAASAGIPLAQFGGAPHLLTRGEMARIAAMFLAHSEGELDAYLDAEKGVVRSSSSSAQASSQSSVSSAASSLPASSSSAPASSSSSSVASSARDFPARSRFLVAGERSHPIASATFFANLEPMYVRNAQVTLMNDIDGIDTMYVIDNAGVQLGQLYLDKVFDNTEKTWRGTFPTAGAYKIPKGEQRVLGVEIRMKDRDQGGTSDELVEVDYLKITTEGEWSTNTVTSVENTFPFPKHQTAMGRIVSAKNAMAESEALPLGPNNVLAAFTIGGSAVPNVSLAIEELEFQVSKSSSVNVTNWQIGIPDSTERWPCTTSDTIVSCSSIPASIGTLGTGLSSRTFRLFGDVTLAAGATDRVMQISLNQAGSVGQSGAIHWTDGTGDFNWVELDSPIARGTRFY